MLSSKGSRREARRMKHFLGKAAFRHVLRRSRTNLHGLFLFIGFPFKCRILTAPNSYRVFGRITDSSRLSRKIAIGVLALPLLTNLPTPE